MTAPITSETSQYSHTTFLEPAICRPRQGTAPPHLNLRPIWRSEDPREHIKVPSVDQILFENDSFSGRGYSNSFLRSSASHHPNQQCLPPPLTEPPSPRPYLGFGLIPSYPEPHQYHMTSGDPHASSGSPAFPLRPSDDWSLGRTTSLQSSQEPFWGQDHDALAGLPDITHKRSYSTLSSDAASTPARETDSQISPVSSESPWDRQCIEVPSPHPGQHDPSPTSRKPIAPSFNENGNGAARARQPVYAARMRTSQACQKCRSRKAKVCSMFDQACRFRAKLIVYSVTETPHARGARPEDCPASMPGGLECEDRTKSRARTAAKKIPTLSADRCLLLRCS